MADFSALTLRLLGPFDLRRGDKPVPTFRTRRGQWLLALLALRHNQMVERSWLAETLWPDSREEIALSNLRRCLTDIRASLAPEDAQLLTATRHTLMLHGSVIWVDWVVFQAAVARGDAASLRLAIDLYRGALLEGCLEEWVIQPRNVAEQTYLSALETLATQARADGDLVAAIDYLRRIVTMEPARESAQALLLETLAAHGDHAAVGEAYRAFRLYAHRELRSEPSAETTALYHRLRARARASTGSDQRQQPPVKIRQESDTGPAIVRLPTPQTSFIGRMTEIAALHDQLDSSTLITLTGIGGVGKTRLAIVVAEEAAHRFPGGVWFTSLADVTTIERLPEAILDSLELPRTYADEPFAAIAARCGEKRGLLILDNLEHLLPDARKTILNLHTRVPQVTLLITSRQPLNIFQESVFPVQPLPIVEESSVTPTDKLDSVRLFAERARARRNSFTLSADNVKTVAAICSRLEGIPLAIELAAAWSALLTPAQLLSRLSERFRLLQMEPGELPERHRSLRAALDVSYRLLPEDIKRFFTRLSVFRGGWTLEAAEKICEEPKALEYLAKLHEASLLLVDEVADEMRFRFLETVREYASELIAPEMLAHTIERHCYYFSQLAATADTLISGPGQAHGAARLEAEQDNFRIAMERDLKQKLDIPRGVQMAGDLGRFWERRSYFREGRDWLFLAAGVENAELVDKIRVRNNLSLLCLRLGDNHSARRWACDALELAERIGYGNGAAYACMFAGHAALFMGEFDAALRYYDQGIAFARANNLTGLMLDIECGVGILEKNRGRFPAAESRLRSVVQLATTMNDDVRLIGGLHNLGTVLMEQGRYSEARDCLQQSLAISRRHGNRYWQGATQGVLGHIACFEKSFSEARRYLEQALEISREMGDEFGTNVNQEHLAMICLEEGDIHQALVMQRDILRSRVRLGVRREIGYSMEALGKIFAALQDWQRCITVLAAAHTLREASGIQLAAEHMEQINAIISHAKSLIEPQAFDKLWGLGQRLSLDEVVEIVFEPSPSRIGHLDKMVSANPPLL